ncbi:TMEM175 family protein [Enterococcus pallens]|uniref:TMEM175 family protein n=1 Tax=Enterococcus pallens TaxID=160454 RepID=UPI0009194DC2|nr:hypothetical protein RV10_GL003778 [Enterococcus pallens]
MTLKERVVLFSDAIIAIILTIMVLELPIKYGTNGALNYPSLFRAIGIYFISFCFVASVWFQMAYAFNAIEKVKNKILVVYMLLLFFLSLVPSATRLLIEDTTQETLLIYGVLTLIVTFTARRMAVSLTKQAIQDPSLQKRRVDELNRQDMFSLLARLVLLVIGWYLVEPVLIIYLILPILAFMQNVADREEDNFVETLTPEQRSMYFEDRGGDLRTAAKRYSQLLRESLKDGDNQNRWSSLMEEWDKRVNQELSTKEQQLNQATDEKEKAKLTFEVAQLKKQQQAISMQQQRYQQRAARVKHQKE